MAKRKAKNKPVPVNITISPGAMDDNAKGQYETVDVFCDQMEKMGMGALLGKDGIKDLRAYNDEQMKKYDPEYLKKKEAERNAIPQSQNEPAVSKEPEQPKDNMVVPKTCRVLDLL
jgi:hypothetical protein